MRHIVTGLFNTEAEAERGRAALQAIGIDPSAIALHAEPAQGSPPATDDAPGGEPGLPRLLDALFLPAGARAQHEAALGRGHVLLAAEVAELDTADAALEALEDAGAIDADIHDRP
jgi:hypothetical protein